jgi:hypothetical protein
VAKTLRELSLDGLAALENVVTQSEYRSLQQAVASLALFSHPDTVRQTQCRNLFVAVRARGERRRGERDSINGVTIEFDDNLFPITTFLYANDLRRWKLKDIQFNHILPMPSDVAYYTNLANIVVLPAFLSKLSDNHKEIKTLLYIRSIELYGPILPGGIHNKPDCYDKLNWAAPLDPVSNVEKTMRRRLASAAKSRITRSARDLGWLFSGYHPDALL